MKRLSFLFVAMLLATPAIAADSTSFNPSTMASVTAQAETPIGTIMTWAVNTAPPTVAGEVIWLPCDGQAIPSGTEYDQLRTLLGSSNLPNLNNNQFLKGSTTDIGKQVAQATVNTTVNIPAHKHDLAGGVAGGQTFTYNAPSGGSGGTQLYVQENSIVSTAPWAVVTCGNDGSFVQTGKFYSSLPECKSSYKPWYWHNFPCDAYPSGKPDDPNRGPTLTCLASADARDPRSIKLISLAPIDTGGGSTTAYGTTSASGLSGTTGAAGATTMTINDVATPAHINVMYYMKVKN